MIYLLRKWMRNLNNPENIHLFHSTTQPQRIFFVILEKHTYGKARIGYHFVVTGSNRPDYGRSKISARKRR